MADSTTKISSEPEKNASTASPGLDDWPSVLDQLEQGSQVAEEDDKGELSLLDEAIAELDQASKTISTVASEFEFDLPAEQAAEDDDIPVLEEAVSLPTDSQAANEEHIPTLGESAIVIHAPQPAAQESDEDEQGREDLLSELEVIAQDLTLPAEEEGADAGAELVMHEQEEALLEQALADDNDSASSGHESSPSSLSGFSDSELEHLPSFVEAASEAVEAADDAQDAVAGQVSRPLQPEADDAQASEFAGEMAGHNPPDTQQAPSPSREDAATTASAVAAAGLGSSLHDALSRRLESLVSEAIASLSDELQQQLAQRMESLLLEAVDQAMPSLMEQLASGLRQQVQSHVQEELPRIVGDMLGSIRVDEQT